MLITFYGLKTALCRILSGEFIMSENNEAFLDEDDGIIELEDEDGNVTAFEFVDRAELNGTVYYALIPVDYDDEEEPAQFVVLKEIIVDGESLLATVDDDDEYNKAGEMFLQRFSEAPDFDDEDIEELNRLDS